MLNSTHRCLIRTIIDINDTRTPSGTALLMTGGGISAILMETDVGRGKVSPRGIPDRTQNERIPERRGQAVISIILPLLGLVILMLLLEKSAVRSARRSLLWLIHVNGIRGKTTVSRMLDAVLRSRYRVMTKTTGSDARIIHVDGRDEPIRRLGPPAIGEQLRMIRLAKREGAQVLILECMAVKPEYQRVCEREMLHSDIGIITNVRYDHMLEMGDSLAQIAASLCETVPLNGSLYTGESAYYGVIEEACARRGSEAFLCTPLEGEGENEAIVRAVTKRLGCDEEEIREGLKRVSKDPGMHDLYRLRDTQGQPVDFLNLFAANDPRSALIKLAPYLDEGRQLVFLFNCRADRPDRFVLFARHFFSQFPAARILLTGSGVRLAERIFLREHPDLDIIKLRTWQAALHITPKGALLVGLGNIKGDGIKLLQAAHKEEGGR